jgi:hypothetical protein
MPRRPNAHVIGTRAVAAVAKIVADAGFAVESVLNDYGEDLLVQTVHAGQMDASRLWLQVKGTGDLARFRRSDGLLRYSFTVDHLRRWVRSADLVMVILWDVSTSRGTWAWPTAQMWQWEGEPGEQREVSLLFDGDCTLSPAVFKDLAWVGRCYHYWQRLVVAEALDEAFYVGSSQCGLAPTAVIAEFLTLIKVASEEPPGKLKLYDGIQARITQWTIGFTDEGPEILEVPDNELVARAVYVAASMVIQENMEMVAGFATDEGLIPGQLLERSALMTQLLYVGYAHPRSLDWVQLLACDLEKPLEAHGFVDDTIELRISSPSPVVIVSPERNPELDRLGLGAALSDSMGEPVEIIMEATPADRSRMARNVRLRVKALGGPLRDAIID